MGGVVVIVIGGGGGGGGGGDDDGGDVILDLFGCRCGLLYSFCFDQCFSI